jgi:hypothetical protein
VPNCKITAKHGKNAILQSFFAQQSGKSRTEKLSPKCTKTHQIAHRISKISLGSYPGPPVIRGGERGGRQEEGNEGKGRMAWIGKGIAFFNI